MDDQVYQLRIAMPRKKALRQHFLFAFELPILSP
jgi:hypothetical protein